MSQLTYILGMFLMFLGSSMAFANSSSSPAMTPYGHYGHPVYKAQEKLKGVNSIPFSVINNLSYQCNIRLTQKGIVPYLDETIALGGIYYPRQYSYDVPYWPVDVTLYDNCSPTGYPYTFTVTPTNPTVTLDPSLLQTKTVGKTRVNIRVGK